MNNELAIAEHSLNAKLWSEYLTQQQDLVDVMRDMGYEKHSATNKQTDILNAQYLYCQDLFSMWMGSDDTYPKFGIVDDTPKVHYIAMAGLRGYIPNYCGSHEDYDSAVDDLAFLHDLTPVKIARLRRDGWLDLHMARDGNEYAQITECDCDDPSVHNDD